MIPNRKTLTAILLTALPGMAANAADPTPYRDQVMATLRPISQTIDTIEAYGVPVNAERHFSYQTQKSRLHLFIRFASGGKSGWAELNLGTVDAASDLPAITRRIHWFKHLKGTTPATAISYLQSHRENHSHSDLEAAEMAVLDLAGRLLGKSTTDILTLSRTSPIPGLFCILSEDPATVTTEARRSLDQNLRSHLKVKLYGNTDIDCAVVRSAREVMGPDAYLTGDVNMGYRRDLSDEPLDHITAAMIALREAGLNACEDPATMTATQWAELQSNTGALVLIPDVPMRPAWKSKLSIDPATGGVFNMHPGCMGSLIETVELGRAIQKTGKKLMVGDASLVGPACPAWQQVAIGLGADWVEALEKPQENDTFQKCLIENPVSRTPEGKFEAKHPKPGFGVEIDLDHLKRLSSGFISI